VFREVRAMTNKKISSPPTPKEQLEKLPQFEPDYCEPLKFSPERQIQTKRLLENFIRDHIRSVEWDGKLTGTDRFIENAILAIARFEHRRGAQPNFDRMAAKKTLKRTIGKILHTRHALQRIANDRELSKFIEGIFVTDIRASHVQENKSTQSIGAALHRSGKVLEAYRLLEPRAMANHLMSLEPLLSMALERVELQSGDFQRDDVAQDFCDDLALAWISGTGRLPTFSKSNPRSRNGSPFAQLLSLVNVSIIEPVWRHGTDFRNYGFNASNKMRKLFPDLAVSREPPRRG
jgi:hypothetical protein